MDKEITYLYIDDRKESYQAVQSFQEKDVIGIKCAFPPKSRKELFQMLSDYDGLIIDQQLDEKEIVNAENEIYYADYSGSSLAIDIRIKENEIRIANDSDISIPIVLYSANVNVPKTLQRLGEEIVDLKIYKADEDFLASIPMYRKQMISLVNAYNRIKNASTISESLGLNEKLEIIDSRFMEEMKRREKYTAHSKAVFILNELIIKQGILVEEDILSVRLGIDKEKSEQGWEKVLTSLKGFGADYRGVFCDGWPRWWMPMVDEWWYSLIDNDTYIRFYNAEQRAKLISEKLGGIQLVPAKAKSKYSIHNEYWTICDFSKEPLDIEDGLLLPGQEDLYPWQDAKYVSIQNALDESIEVAECDKEKLETFKNK